MTDVFTLTIDGKDVAGTAGETVMEVAEENGIDIPGLCHLEGISDRGACRLCMVEIAGSPKLAAACMTRISEGMEVTAHSEKLLEYRQSITEM
ncbi:MAG TPA: 2Fe-2S iron-sulfur cluster-binding protein, partial [Candidatus Deferrimicrobium sp.]|nr:2Fe-2S iron-sulfur cluster-binding protein [Candidatus Deferrimicrobium sp.]